MTCPPNLISPIFFGYNKPKAVKFFPRGIRPNGNGNEEPR